MLSGMDDRGSIAQLSHVRVHMSEKSIALTAWLGRSTAKQPVEYPLTNQQPLELIIKKSGLHFQPVGRT